MGRQICNSFLNGRYMKGTALTPVVDTVSTPVKKGNLADWKEIAILRRGNESANLTLE